MKVYVVTYGCYSSIYIAGVFSDKAEADRYAGLDEDGSVDENILDEMKGAESYEVLT